MTAAARDFFRNDFSFLEANRRIESWLRRGYVLFSDRHTRSTHLRGVGDSEGGLGGNLAPASLAGDAGPSAPR